MVAAAAGRGAVGGWAGCGVGSEVLERAALQVSGSLTSTPLGARGATGAVTYVGSGTGTGSQLSPCGRAVALLVQPLRVVGLLDQGAAARLLRGDRGVGSGAGPGSGSSAGSPGAADEGWWRRGRFSRSRCAAASALRRSMVKAKRRRSLARRCTM